MIPTFLIDEHWSRFKISSNSIPSNYSSSVTTFSTGLSYSSRKTWLTLKVKLEKSEKTIFANVFRIAIFVYCISSNKRLLNGAYWILKLWGVVLIRGMRWLEGGAYFEVREMNNIKCQNLVIFSIKIRPNIKFCDSVIWLT